jgi:hypothetical protein
VKTFSNAKAHIFWHLYEPTIPAGKRERDIEKREEKERERERENREGANKT